MSNFCQNGLQNCHSWVSVTVSTLMNQNKGRGNMVFKISNLKEGPVSATNYACIWFAFEKYWVLGRRAVTAFPLPVLFLNFCLSFIFDLITSSRTQCKTEHWNHTRVVAVVWRVWCAYVQLGHSTWVTAFLPLRSQQYLFFNLLSLETSLWSKRWDWSFIITHSGS